MAYLSSAILRGTHAARPASGDATLAGRLYFETDTNLTFRDSGTAWEAYSSTGVGDVVGPASATDNHLAVFDGVSGKLLKDGGAIPSGKYKQIVNTLYTTKSTTTTAIPSDDSIPQNTEGAEIMTLAITPASATNYLLIDALIFCANSGLSIITAALFQDSTANALSAAYNTAVSAHYPLQVNLSHYMVAGTTNATTFKIRVGPESGTLTFNGVNNGRKYGGVMACSLTIREIG